MKGLEKCKHILAFLLVIMLTVQQTSIITLADELTENTVVTQSQEEMATEETTENSEQDNPATDPGSSEGNEETAEITSVPEQTTPSEPIAAPDSTDESVVENQPDQNEETTDEMPSIEAAAAAEAETQKAAESGKAAVQTAETPSSDSLNNFVTGIVLEGAAKGENNSYRIEADQDYKITLSFAEDRNLQFDNGGTLYYTLPAGVTLADAFKGTAHYFDIGNLKNNTITYDEASNRLIIHLNTSDEVNYEKYKAAADAEFSLWLDVRFNENVTQIDFGHDIKLDITVNTNYSLRVSKNARYDKDNGCINYEVKVTSDGNNHDVVLTDTLSGSLMRMYSADDVNTICSNKKGDLKSTVSPVINGNTMSLQIPFMENGEEITVKYSAKVDYDQITVQTAATLENTRNSVSAKSREVTNEVTASSGVSVDKMYEPMIQKDASRNNTVVTYTITVNGNYRYDVSGKEIKDKITQNPGYMKYSGDGITVRKFDTSGNQVGSDINISWTQLNVDKETTKEWTYSLPSEAGKYKYTIIYTADVLKNNNWGNITVRNQAEYTDGSNGYNAYITLGPVYGSFYIGKSGEIIRDEATKKKQIQWTVAFDTVANMSYDNCWVNDELPSTLIDNQRYSDSLLEDTVKVTGLSDEESYEVEKYTENNINKFKIKFYYTKDGNKVAGLKTSDKSRRITITYLTDPNQTWLDKSDMDHYKEHKNTARLYTDGKNSYFTRAASVDLYKRDVNIEKKAYIQSTDSNGLSVIRYEVVITGIDSDTVTVDDIFDKDQLVYYTDDNLKPTIGFDNCLDFQTNRGGKLTYTETNNGAQFVISEIPKNEHKDYYPHCKLTYYLKVNGQKALESIATSSEGGKVRNTAKVGDEASVSDIAVAGNLSPVRKDMIEGNENNGYVATYTLTINENQRKYGTEEYLDVDDKMENVWLTDIDSMKITTEPAGKEKDVVFTLDETKNLLHFKVPNETKVVISYQAKWTGKGELNHINTVSVFGYASEKSVLKDASASGSGSFNNYQINIYKSDVDDSFKALEGAVFKLQEFVGSSWTDVTGKGGTAVTVATNANGKAHIEGHQDSLGWVLYPDTKYRLVEVEAPEGYEKLSEENSPVFTISKDGKHGAADGTVYYSNGDTIYVSDQKIPESDVEISKVEAAGGKELAGAKLTITDANGATVESWTSGEAKADRNEDGSAKAHKVKLTAGTYTLTEESAPEGYKTAESITFTVGVNGKVTVDGKEVDKVIMTDELAERDVEISKVEAAGGKELAGAKLTITDANGATVESWTSGEAKADRNEDGSAKAHKVKLTAGTYTLTEESAPEGYKTAESITFTVGVNGKVTVDGKEVDKVIMTDELAERDVEISKVEAAGGKELAGAKLTITDANGATVESWTSGEAKADRNEDGSAKAHKVKLTAGTYTLTEESAPEGYKTAESITFTVGVNGKVTVDGKEVDKVIMTDELAERDVEISKVEAAGGKELAGAKLTITDANGATVESWTSGEAKADRNEDGSAKAHKVKLTAGTYTLTEESAPEGYKTAESITFTVGVNGKVTVNGKEVDKVIMTDEPISVSIKKTDIVDGKELAGAKLQILDRDKNVATNIKGEKLEWISGTEAKVIEGLKAGETYYLHEETAPTGYTIASDTTFTLKTDGTIDTEKTTTVVKDGIFLVQDSMIKSEKASIKVTKTLVYNNMELGAADQTFYTALYGDENCINRISEVKALVYKNSDTATVEFKNLEVGRKYYVSECDANGTALTSGVLADANKTTYISNFPDGNTVTVDKADATKEIRFQNEFMNIPDGFYKVGKLNITKKLLGSDGKVKNSDEIFYAGIFEDEGFTKLSGNVSQNIVPLEMNGESEITAQVKVSMVDGDSITLYVTEVDADGNPVADAENFTYEVTVDGSKVTLNADNMTGNVTITNQELKEENEETEETAVEKTSTEKSSSEKAASTATKSVKTGDNTPIAAFVILLIAAVAAIVAGIYFKRRKK